MSDFVAAGRIIEAKRALDRVRENMRATIRGKDDVIDHVLVCLAAGGHLLLEDLPGVGKTTLAYALARSLDCSFSRIQFTSDLLPGDVTGVAIYDETTRARSITSSRADWVFGVVRLISSARTIFAKTGPFLKRNSRVVSS